MKTITLKQRNGNVFECFYDDEDHLLLSQYHWSYSLGYAVSKIANTNKKINMQRLILGILNKPEIMSDHKNRNRLDNRRSNLRRCTRTENNRNISSYGKTSNYLGVCIAHTKYKERTYKSIKAQIRENGKNKHLGCFKTEEDAARVYDVHAKRIYGEFANLNFKE